MPSTLTKARYCAAQPAGLAHDLRPRFHFASTAKMVFRMVNPSNTPPLIASEQELRSAFDLILKHMPEREISAFSLRLSPATVYTTLTTLLILTLQRLSGGCSLDSVVREVLANHSQLFPDNKRVLDGTLSENPSGFSRARLKLSVETTERFCDVISESLIRSYHADLQESKTYVIDGTTLGLAPTDELAKVYPPARNQYGQSVWPIMQLTVAHELISGVALRPEFGAMYGADNTSEAKQIEKLIKRLPANSILLADSGYGIFRVVYRCTVAKHKVIFRLNNSRFKSMVRSARLVNTVDGIQKYELLWKPSVKDLKCNPELPRDAQVLVTIYSKVRYNLQGKEEALHVVSQMDLEPAEAMAAYAQRYNRIENDIRDLKVTLNLEQIRAQSDEMVRKEILCGMTAYNMVNQLRRLAAAKAGVEPKRISFRRSLDTTRSFLLAFGRTNLEEWTKRFQQAIDLVSKDLLPIRPGRSFPRKAHPKRPKSTKLKQRKPAENDTKPPDPPNTG